MMASIPAIESGISFAYQNSDIVLGHLETGYGVDFDVSVGFSLGTPLYKSVSGKVVYVDIGIALFIDKILETADNEIKRFDDEINDFI